MNLKAPIPRLSFANLSVCGIAQIGDSTQQFKGMNDKAVAPCRERLTLVWS